MNTSKRRAYVEARNRELRIINMIINLQELRAKAEIANVLFQLRLTTEAVTKLLHISGETIRKMENMGILHRQRYSKNTNDEKAEEIYTQIMRERFEAINNE